MNPFPASFPNEAKAKAGLKLLSAALEALKDGILIAGPEGLIVSVNPAFSRLTGFNLNEPGFPKTVDELFPWKKRPTTTAEIAKSPTSFWSGECLLRGAQGEKIPVLVCINHVREEDGSPQGFTISFTDQREKQRIDERLRMFEMAVEYCLEPVLITDAEPINEPGPRIVYANKAFTEVTGYTMEEVLGKTPRILQGPKSSRAELDKIRKALTEWKSVKAELLNYRKDGSEFWVELGIFPVANEKGWFTHWVSVQRDITQKKHLEQENLSARDASEKASHAKSSFLANMSHEIRTPLTAIIGYSDILLDSHTPATQIEESALAIRRNGRHLLKIVGNILDLSKIEAGKAIMETIAYSPWRIVKEVDSSQHVMASEKMVRFKTIAAGALPAECLIDPTWVRQILLNLVSNAIKFTNPGGSVILTVEASRIRTNDENITLQFSVKDDGIGIDENEIERLFEAFEQADNSTPRKHGGTGLGLNISRKLIELMGGTIAATSSPGKGSCFTIRIPCHVVDPAKEWVQPENAKNLSKPETPKSEGFRPPSIPHLSGRLLLVDDNADNRLILNHHIRPTGLLVEMAENGRQAIEKAMAKPFDVILLDMQMPEVDGYTAARELRRCGYDQPIIALTAHAMSEDRLRCLKAGCSDYLSKPVVVDDLYSILRQALNTTPKMGPEEFPLRANLSNDDPILVELSRDYASRLGLRMEELRRAFETENRVECAAIAHSISGSAGMYGFEPVSKAAGLIEESIRKNSNKTGIARLIDDLANLIHRVEVGLVE